MLQKNKTYLVLNPNPSGVAVSTRHESYLIPGGTEEAPGTWPFSVDEIIQINANSIAFKAGCLFFEPEFEEDIYKELRIYNWRDILRNKDIEDIILYPTREKLQRIVDIDNDFVFERAYGVYVGLKSANYGISGNVQTVFNTRHKEFKAGKRKSAIVLSEKPSADNAELEEMRAKLAAMEEMVRRLTQASADTTETVVPETPVEAEKPTPKPRAPRKTPAKKPTGGGKKNKIEE